MKTKKVAIVGASGYSGEELVRLLLNHPHVELAAVTSRQNAGQTLAQVFPKFAGHPRSKTLRFVDPNAELLACQADIVFLALPHGVAAEYAIPLNNAGCVVIDLSADFRLKNADVYKDFYAPNIRLHRSPISREQVLDTKARFPHYSRYELAAILGCSEQTIDRRLNGNNIRGGKYSTQTRVKVVGGFLEEVGLASGLYLYDHRVWMKDPTWANSQWHSSSYRAVSEFEDLYVFWKPGETLIDRHRLSDSEWSEWGSRGVWQIRSVQKNDDHPAKFPLALAKRVIRLYSGKNDIVLDPFLGSGTTAIAAIQTGRRFIGIEKEKRYFDTASRHIQDANSLLIKSDC